MDLPKTKIVGVLGGYGPYATNDFFQLLLENSPAEKDWDHLHTIIDSNPRIPSRARAFLFDEESPVPYMKQAISRLKNAGADFFVCPCNTAHHFIRNMGELELPFLDMVEATTKNILNDGIKSIGVLGSEVTVMSKIYESELIKNGVSVHNVDDLQDVRTIIEAGKQNKGIAEARDLMSELIRKFKAEGAEAVIYACTELPLIIPIDECELKVYDSSSVLAKETITFAKQF